jgi:DNA/RNA endonuclease YhcR with UshA esterase domain
MPWRVMMRDSELLKISFLISTLGLGLLFFVSSKYDESLVSISQIDYDSVGNRVTVAGEIFSKRNHRDGHIFLKLGDTTGNISIVLFNPLVESLEKELLACLEVGEHLLVKGRVEEYRGALEVVPRKKGDVACLRSSPQP